MEFSTRAFLQEQRSFIVEQANFELNMQEVKAENTVQNFTQQLRHQFLELSSRSQDCQKSRDGQLQLIAELRNRE